jgi:hypothetical protein
VLVYVGGSERGVCVDIDGGDVIGQSVQERLVVLIVHRLIIQVVL